MTSILAPPQPRDRAFEGLYRAHVQDVYRYSLMLLRNVADAEDVVQTTFMKAYRAIQRGERPRHPRRWLITIAHNTCRTRARDEQRRPRQVELDEALPDPSPGDDEAVDVESLVRALGALSFNQRSALVMRELEGRSYAEIAKLLEVSPSAVETLLFRARRALREQLEGPLTCGEAERALSLQLDGRLPDDERGYLRAHLRECEECSSLARRERARRSALRSLGPLPLPASIASWSGAASAPGIAIKVAALLAAGAAAIGATQEPATATRDPEPRAHPAAVAAVAASASPALAPAPTRRAAAGPDVRRLRPLAARTKLVEDTAPAPAATAPAPTAAAPSAAPAAQGPAPRGGGVVAATVPTVRAVATAPVALPEVPVAVRVEVAPEPVQVAVPAPVAVPEVAAAVAAPALP